MVQVILGKLQTRVFRIFHSYPLKFPIPQLSALSSHKISHCAMGITPFVLSYCVYMCMGTFMSECICGCGRCVCVCAHGSRDELWALFLRRHLHLSFDRVFHWDMGLMTSQAACLVSSRGQHVFPVFQDWVMNPHHQAFCCCCLFLFYMGAGLELRSLRLYDKYF